ncbi:transposable element Tc1 transposase [Trichonephila clavipes]|uniref:Transposable element Tc1 transposase n=1 Tax=Trichonephila clavipes TaxID=2585209 RepID=A0A8X6W429_TRICX|nr:transposable element Tc1 transposase [Trichonephila clavipes]
MPVMIRYLDHWATAALDIHEKYNKNIWAATARKILKQAGYRSRVARRKPYISMTNRLKRIALAKERIHKPPMFWGGLIFSDESKYCIFGIKSRKLVWRKPFTALKKEHLAPTVKHGGRSHGVGVHGEQCCRQVGVYRINYEQI